MSASTRGWWLLCVVTACTGPKLVVGELAVDASHDASSDAEPQPNVCTDSTMCAGGEPHCDLTSGRCVECLVSDHCVGEHPLCDIARGQCVDCLLDTDCPDRLFCQRPEGECEDTP